MTDSVFVIKQDFWLCLLLGVGGKKQAWAFNTDLDTPQRRMRCTYNNFKAECQWPELTLRTGKCLPCILPWTLLRFFPAIKIVLWNEILLQHGWTLKTVKEARHKEPPMIRFCLYWMVRIGKSRQKADVAARSWVVGKGECWGDWRWWLRGVEFLFGMRKMFWNWLWWWLHNSVNILKATELYTINGWTVWHVNYVSIKTSFF